MIRFRTGFQMTLQHSSVFAFGVMFVLSAALPLTAQTNTFPSTGNAGIGTLSPGNLLELSNNGSTSPGLRINNGAGRWQLGVGAQAPSDGLFSIYDVTHNANRFVIDSNGQLGIGTTAPGAMLDLRGSSYRLTPNSAVQEFDLNFPNATSNAKIDVIFNQPGDVGLWGVVDAELTDGYGNENDAGGIHKRYYIGFNGASLFMNQSRVVDEGGATSSHYAISDIVWDATLSKFKITIAHSTSGGEIARLRLTQFVAYPGTVSRGSVLVASLSAPYSTDPTVFPRPYVYYNNPIGFGTSTPDQQVDIRGNIAMGRRAQTALTRYVGLPGTDGSFGGSAGTTGMAINQTAGGDSQLQFYTGQWGSPDQARMTITKAGTVGIGTTTPCAGSSANCMLAVKGAVRANEVIVDTGWSDYVFDPDYKLAPLSDVAAYVAGNHHLPDIPSAKEVQEKGISLGEMQSKLLAKIEELTLHMIELDQRNAQLTQQNREFAGEIEELRKGNQR